jgi:hypothetical protein
MEHFRTPVVPLLQHAGCSDQCGTFTPEDDGPPVVIVGALASDESIRSVARRHGLDFLVVQAFARKGGVA